MNLNFRKAMLFAAAFAGVGTLTVPAYAGQLGAPTEVQQQKKISGTVTDVDGPIIGASVLEKGTSNGTVTDLDGNFSLSVKPGATLVISYVGYKTVEVKVGNQASVGVKLESDNVLDDVVVVGYGTMKKKLVTGATVQVKGEDIAKMNTTQALGALQSQTPGVTIQAVSGQPGAGFKVAVRGAGTNGNTAPLYVIDGVAGGDINNINPADIESIDVLKDAASCAIYGSAAANGVILITTKQGKAGEIQITYDGNIGWQNIYRAPSLLTAKEYMQVQDLARFNTGLPAWNWDSYFQGYENKLAAYRDGSDPGTNWFNEIRNKNAITTSHALNIAGGNEFSKYSVGAGYQYQDGIVGTKEAPSDFRRFTFRINSEHVIAKSSKGFDIFKVGENVYWQHKQSQGINNGNQYANPLADAIRHAPIVPVYANDGTYFDLEDYKATGLFNYNTYLSNPVMLMRYKYGDNESRSYGLNAVGYVEIQPIKGLIYRGQIAYNQSSWSWRNYQPVYAINEQGDFRPNDLAKNQVGLGWGWSTTNTLNYKFDLGKNNFDVLVGTEYGKSKPNYGFKLKAEASGATIPDMDHAYMDMMETKSTATVSGAPYGDSRGMSYFGRLNYNYGEKYMFSAIIRADGSSIFAPGHRWGYFPSFSAGWVISEEAFMEPIKDVMDYFKLRAGWGQNGNKNIAGAFQYEAAFKYPDVYSNYSFGTDIGKFDVPTQGASLSRLANADLTWETSEQINVGFDARFLNSRLNVNFDWYQKTTKDLLVYVPVSPTTGFDQALKNAGTVRNRGVELALTWRDRIGSDFNYSIGYNVAYNQNKVTKVNASRKYNPGGNNLLSQGTTYLARFEEGQPIGYFWGYKTDGVIQNADDLAAYIATLKDGNPINSVQGEGLKVGDLKFVDTNGDHIINSDDKTNIGDPNPDFTMGLNLGFDWKGLDFSLTGYAALGQQIAYGGYRRFADSGQDNFTTAVYNYWVGENTSNRYPQLNVMNTGSNWQELSDIYMQNGSYFRLQNVTLGYDVNRLWKKSPFQQLRVYVQAQNLFTITGYEGMDPENGKAINDDPNDKELWVTGVDVGNYPNPRTFLVGVNVKLGKVAPKAKAVEKVYAPNPEVIEKIVEKVVEKPVVKEVVKETVVGTGIHVVQFAVGSYELTEEAKAELRKVSGTVDVVAYASPEGNADANQTLSENRAKAIADFLSANGVNVRKVAGEGAPNSASNRIGIVSEK